VKPKKLTQLRESKYFRAGVGGFFLRGASLGLMILGSILLARVLGPAQLGLYSFALALVAIAGLPVQMGIPTLVLRETARFESSRSWARVRGVWTWASRRIIFASAVVIPVIGLAAWVLKEALPPGGLPPVFVSLALIPLIALALLRGAALGGLHRPVLGQLPESLVRPGGFVLVLAVAAIVGAPLSATCAMGLQVAATALAFAVGATILLRAAPAEIKNAPEDVSCRHEWNRAVWPLAMIAGMQIVLQSLDILMLGIWRTAEEVGLYKIAASAASLTVVGLTIVNLVIVPSFARLHSGGDIASLGRMAATGAAWALGTALPVAALLVLAGPLILSLLYGESFRLAYEPMVILIVGQVVNAFYGSCVSLLNMSGHERTTLRGLTIATVINVGLNAVLIPSYGVSGAAIATLVSTVVWNVLLGRSVRRLLGVACTPLGLITGGGK
jgi:O-antigen/teichoic acid export membrane protein|tara:strand:- start:11712 stop:13043 length:1332 start_codon:yes stop_codon:yes gene_type:complete